MYQCKKCGTPLEKGTDVCPICGDVHPLGNIDALDASDMTKTFTPVEPEYELVKQKSRLATWVLALLLGFSGAPLFYLGFTSIAIFWLVSNVAIIALTVILWPLGWIIYAGLGLVLLLNIGLAIFYAIPHDQKDARGEFLK